MSFLCLIFGDIGVSVSVARVRFSDMNVGLFGGNPSSVGIL